MKNKTISIIFMIFLISLSFFNAIRPIVDVSFAERRHLKQFDELEFIDFLSGDFIEAFDQAAVDQFIFRDHFRSLKAQLEFGIFNKTDNNDIVVTEEGVFKLEYPLNENSVQHLAEYISEIQREHLSGSKVYISIIPDKTYYWNGDIPKIDYQELEQLLTSQLTDMIYIDIKDALTLEDFYLTDPHWKQEKLTKVIEQLALAMDFKIGSQEFEEKVYSPFYGAYYGQAALNTTPDTLTYLYNEQLLKAVIKNYEKPDVFTLYDEEKLGEMDAYDVFLSGSSALITIENPEAEKERELVIFRDSFSSSLAPLLVESYSKITLVDLRYMSRDLLGEYVDFEDKDVLFLYSSLVVNNSIILK
jgi:hypothetical protein